MQFFKLSWNLYNSTALDVNKVWIYWRQRKLHSLIDLESMKFFKKILTALNHPKLHSNQSASIDEFKNLINIGDKALTFFTKEYIKTRFLRLKGNSAEIGWKTFWLIKMSWNWRDSWNRCGLWNRFHSKKTWKEMKRVPGSQRRWNRKQIAVNEDLNIPEIQLDCFKALRLNYSWKGTTESSCLLGFPATSITANSILKIWSVPLSHPGFGINSSKFGFQAASRIRSTLQ